MIEKKDWSKELSRDCYKILEQIFMEPPPDILWRDILGLFYEIKDKIGGKIVATPGRNVRVSLNGGRAIFDEPDPKLKTALYNITRVRKLLISVGVIP